MPKSKRKNDSSDNNPGKKSTRGQDTSSIKAKILEIYSGDEMKVPTEKDFKQINKTLDSMYGTDQSLQLQILQDSNFSIIARLYSNLTAVDFLAKLEATESPFFFLRTFVPFYYSVFAEKETLPFIAKLKPFTGWCAGDAHLENFGTSIMNDKETPVFSINDFDDAGHTYLVADAIRFFTSALLGIDDIDDASMELIVNRYFDGLKEEKVVYNSETVNAALDKSVKNGFKVKENVMDKDENKLSTKGSASRIKKGKKLFDKLENTLKEIYGKGVDLVDVVEEVRVQGGSGGLTRYLTLITDKKYSEKKGKYIAIEFKEETKPGVWPLVKHAGGVIEPFSERLAKTLQYEIPSTDGHGYYRAAVLKYLNDGVPTEYLLRPRLDEYLLARALHSCHHRYLKT